MKNREIAYVSKMIEYIDKSLNYTKWYSFDSFSKDDKTIDATIFNIGQIGESIKKISEETIKKYDNIEWQMIKGLRNRIIHDYSGINLNNIWYIINNDLPLLREDLFKILNDLK